MLLTNATLATMTNGTSLMEGAAILIEDDHIAWVGPMADAPACADSRDLGGRLVTPGLIDCHTHLVHGGNRAREFEMRLNGASYEAVARAGGGIISTVRATREASEADLLASALLRLDRMLAEGVTTVEVKSGYGLTVADELKMLRVARGLTKARPVTVQVVLGKTSMPVANLVKLGRGAVVKLDTSVGDPVDLMVNGRVVARGEVVVLENEGTRFGITLTEIVSPGARPARSRPAAA